ncbi:MAG: M20/M25/M40 family metallo-hydrolase [Ahniella sp.]|nr:M20/M25/M40 family metallo-hydrolase [Ahniella sp.]
MKRALVWQSFLASFVLAAPAVFGAPTIPPFSTDQRFDAAAIAPYAGDHGAIHDRIDADLPKHIEALQRWVKQRSISAQNDGVRDMANMLADDLRALKFGEVSLVETKGHPGVVGFYDAGAARTLLVYMMYDVQPVDPNWRIEDPFAGALVEHDTGTVLMARGATNQKGPQRAFLNAVESILAVDGKLPVNLVVVAEGEEELGSPNFAEVIEPYLDRLRKADGAFFPMNLQNAKGEATLNLGVKGIIYFELESVGGDWGWTRSQRHPWFDEIDRRFADLATDPGHCCADVQRRQYHQRARVL